MYVKPVFRWTRADRKLRIFRLLWGRGTVGDGNGYSAKLAVSLVPSLVGFDRVWDGWRVTFLGLDVHYRCSYGGRFV